MAPQENTYGVLLYSGFELIEPQVRFLVDDQILPILAQVKLDSGVSVELYRVYPTPPVPGENSHSTERDKELLIVARQVKERGGSSIVIGDQTDVAWSYTDLFTKINGLLDPRIGRGFFNIFHARYLFCGFHLIMCFVQLILNLLNLRVLGTFRQMILQY